MALLKPTIKALLPAPPIVLHTTGGSPQGFSGLLQLNVEVRTSPGASLPINGVAVLTIINADQYRFRDGSAEIESGFQQKTSVELHALSFSIKSVHLLASTPAPLLLTVCTYDTISGEENKLCHSGQFAVTRSGAAVKIKSFK